MRNVLVVHCHPLADSLAAAARDRVLAGLGHAGVTPRLRDLYAEGWDHSPDLATHQADLAWCDTLVFVYPTWWSGQPAMLTDWVARCWPPGTQRRNIGQLIAVTTHGSPKRINALEGETGKRILSRWVRPMCSRRARLGWIALYGVDTATPTQFTMYLDTVEERFATRR